MSEYVKLSYLSVSEECIHSFKEARLHDVRLVQNEANLLVLAACMKDFCLFKIIKTLSLNEATFYHNMCNI
jgi:hypothetical protein